MVNALPVKAAIDDQMSHLFDALVGSLRKAISAHIAEIDSFVEGGMEALSQRPSSLDEIAEVNAKHGGLSRKKPAMQPLFQLAESKDRLLR